MQSRARRGRHRCACLLLSLTFVLPATAQNTSWPGFRGLDGNGRLATSRPGADELRLAWKIPLGAGYSGITLHDGAAVTMAALDDVDPPGDYLIAFDPETGARRWELRVADIYPGRDGALDGPVSTPAISGSRVFALDPGGRLVAARLSDGELLWARELRPTDDAAPLPIYGYGTSPIAYADLVVVQTGGERAVQAFDAATGEPVWHAASGPVEESSPLLLELHGRSQVVYSTLHEIGGLDPDEGTALWTWRHDAGPGGAFGAETTTPLPVGKDRLFMTPSPDTGVMIRVPEVSGQTSDDAVETVWEQTAMTRTYSPPTLWGDTLFGYTSRLLSAFDLETGERLWRSRDPGDGFLVAADGRLILATKSGGVHLAEASRDGYRELDALDLFDELVWTPPTPSGAAVFVRSIGELARIDLVSSPVRTTDLTPEDQRLPALLEELDSQLRAGAAADEAVDALLDWLETPVIEGNRALFLWRGEATDVGLGGDFFGMRSERPLTRIEGTDLWWREVTIDPRLQYAYTLFVDFQPTLDPLNPRRELNTIWGPDLNWIREGTFETSWFAGASWPGPPGHLRAGATSDRPGKLVSHRIPLPPRDDPPPANPQVPPRPPEVEISVWLPPGYDDTSERYPVVYVHGPAALELGRWRETLDRTVGESFRPLIALFVPTPLGLPPRDFREVVVPWVDETFRTVTERTGRANVAWFWDYLDVALQTLAHPDLFAGLATQSYHGFDIEAGMVEQGIAAADAPEREWRLYFDWTIADSRSPSEGWNMAVSSQKLVEMLRGHGFEPIVRPDLADTTDWKSWRNRTHELLGALFPPDAEM